MEAIMRTVELIQKKREGGNLSDQEIKFLVDGFVAGEIPSYQISALLMAIFFRGMESRETVSLTRLMLDSGAKLDTSGLAGLKVDKHSTGGVGDKTSLIIAPIVAEAGLFVPMMSGRGLGHTGGTLDKLESMKGYRVFLEREESLSFMAQCGYVMMGQTKDMVPADRLLYALRDATATVESIPLITASILSKKKAEGTDGLFLDVKTGSGAFMKTLDESRALARSLVDVGTGLGMNVEALITDMDSPLGTMIGNFLEVEECWRCMANDHKLYSIELTTKGFEHSGPSGRLVALSLESAARMLVLGKAALDLQSARSVVLEIHESGKALGRFRQNIDLQGGNSRDVEKQIGVFRAPLVQDFLASGEGYVQCMDALAYGLASVSLGAGRNKAEDSVLPDVGIELFAEPGTPVAKGQVLARLYGQSEAALEGALEKLTAGTAIATTRPMSRPLIHEEVISR